MASSPSRSEGSEDDAASTDEPKQKLQKHNPEISFEVDGSVVWSGTAEAFGGGSFMRLSVSGKRWIVKPINRVRFDHHPLAINLVAEALHLGSTTGVLQSVFILRGLPEPMTLEAEVPCLLKSNPLGKAGCIWDVNEQAKAKAAAISLADLNHAKDCDRLDSVSTDSVQRLGLLVMLTRCKTINLDDILLRRAADGLELVLGDAKKAFVFGSKRSEDRYWKSPVFDEEEKDFRPGGPLDEMKTVFECVQMSMARSTRYEHVEWSDDYGWMNEDGEDRRAFVNTWVRWEKRPLARSVAQLLLAWTPQEIDAALDAEARARRDLTALEAGCVAAASSSAAAANNADADADAPASSAWKAHWKEALLELQEQVRGGRRPSLLEISAALAKKRTAK